MAPKTPVNIHLTTTHRMSPLLPRSGHETHQNGPSTSDGSQSDIATSALDIPEPVSTPNSKPSSNVIRYRTTSRLFAIYLDLLLASTPVLFILLGIAAATLNGKRTKDNHLGAFVEKAMSFGPTVFPILFATIAARSIRVIARVHAERGANLAVLEMLVASRSVSDTFQSQLALRHFTLVGALLMGFWALSPFGGQASLRLLTISEYGAENTTEVRYFDTGPSAGIWLASGFSGTGSQLETIENSLLSAAILSPDAIKLSPRDTWGNVKIPRIEALNESAADSLGWIDIPSSVSHNEMFETLGMILNEDCNRLRILLSNAVSRRLFSCNNLNGFVIYCGYGSPNLTFLSS